MYSCFSTFSFSTAELCSLPLSHLCWRGFWLFLVSCAHSSGVWTGKVGDSVLTAAASCAEMWNDFQTADIKQS